MQIKLMIDGYFAEEVLKMDRGKAIQLIEDKAAQILGGRTDAVAGKIGDGCEVEGEALWVFWPTLDGAELYAVYSDAVMDRGVQIDPAEHDLAPGYRQIQQFIAEIEDEVDD